MLSNIRRWEADEKAPVRNLVPACSATVVLMVRIVDPAAYPDEQREQQNVYSRENCTASGNLF